MKLNYRNTKSDWSQRKMSMGGVKSERSKTSSNLTRFRLDKIQKNIPPLSLICSCFVSSVWCFLRGYSISVPNQVWRQMSGSKSSDGRWWVLVKYWIYYQGSTHNNAHTHIWIWFIVTLFVVSDNERSVITIGVAARDGRKSTANPGGWQRAQRPLGPRKERKDCDSRPPFKKGLIFIPIFCLTIPWRADGFPG